MTANLHLIPLLPLLGAAFSLLFGKRLGKNVVTLVTCGAVAAAALVTLQMTFILHHDLPPGGALVDTFFEAPWMKAGDLNLSAGLWFDALTAVMCCVVTVIGFLIHVYASAYMEHDENYTRFFAYLNLFMGAMLILVLGDSMPVTFVGWEGVGLCSYLLIGFWFDKDANATAGRKAFVVNRIGDFGFLLAMFLIFYHTGTLKYSELASHIDGLHNILWLGLPVACFAGLLVLVGATGKSAQIPLYVWLPDAMAGPTPVSALIHAATMVTAGVYVTSRLHVVYEAYPQALAWIAGIGALTALFAATIGFAQRDLKKVLAYSTISQLGFMFVAVGSYVNGSSNYASGVFHLMTHAFFKAGLFLGAGSVMHAMENEGDIMKMGGLRKHLPHTHATFLIYCLAIAGIFPLAGFWSKDAILGGAFAAQWDVKNAGPVAAWFAMHAGKIIYGVMLTAAGCTAFYMFRLYYLVFHGKFRGTHEQEHHLHESPARMTVVLWCLAIGTILSGFLGVPESILPESLHHFGDLLGEWLKPVVGVQLHEESAGQFLGFAFVATAVSVAGIGSAYIFFLKDDGVRAKNFVATFPRLYRVVFNKYYVDEFYNAVVVRPLRGLSRILWKFFDEIIIDKLFVGGTAAIVNGFGKSVKYLQNGDAQRYVVGVLVGMALILRVSTHYSAAHAAQFHVDQDGHAVTAVPQNDAYTTNVRFKVEWGDGQESDADSAHPRGLKHQYASSGTYKIRLETTDSRWQTTASRSETVVVR